MKLHHNKENTSFTYGKMTMSPKKNLQHLVPTGNSPRIAVIGCGAIAEIYYLPALARHWQIIDSLILVDQNIHRAQMLAAKFGCKKHLVDYHEVLAETDGAIIALPTHLHHPVASEFLSRKIPVLCEKPLAESVGKAREMVSLAQTTGTALATNYSQRLWAQFARTKEIIRDGAFGKPVSINYHVGETFNWPTVSGFYFNATGSRRGVLLDRGAHVIDHICWWVGGKPEVVSSKNDSFGGIETVAEVKFHYGDCKGEITLNWLSNFPCKFVVTFEHGLVEGDVSYPQNIFITSENGQKKRVSLQASSWFGLGEQIVDNFIAVICQGKEPLVPGSDVLDSIAMIDECYANATNFPMPWYDVPEVRNAR